LSPERARGAKRLDPRADFFSLGGILYHMLTGGPPFRAETGLDVFLRKLSAEPLPNTKALSPHMSDEIVKVVMKLMAKDPAARYPSAVLLIDDLKEVARGAPAQHTRLDMRRQARNVRRRPNAKGVCRFSRWRRHSRPPPGKRCNSRTYFSASTVFGSSLPRGLSPLATGNSSWAQYSVQEPS
jgi:serine/threonine protein kinase